MQTQPQPNKDQNTLWNGTGGQAWVTNQATLDRMFAPFEPILMEALPPGAGHRVLDVGCGTGGITLAAARRTGAQGDCLGIDISGPMLAAARTRAEQAGLPARFLQADAQTHAFAPASADRIVSRFGVMFFEDPVAAFANLHRAARPGAAMRLIAWRGAEENPFMTTAERAAAPLLPDLPARQPNAPGQFGFADRRRVAAILGQGGWAEVDITPIDVDCTLAEADLERYFSSLNMVGQRLQTVNDATRAAVVRTVRAAFAPFVNGDTVRFTAACWQIDARAPA